MTAIDQVEYVLGILSLAAMAGLSGSIFRDAYAQRHRILAALRGEPISPAASVVPLTTALPQQRDVEAVTLPTSPARAALGGVA